MASACIYCACDRLMAPHEPVVVGSVIICGACGSLMIAALFDPDEGPETIRLRRPTELEAKRAHADRVVIAALDAYNLVTLERMGATKPKPPSTGRPIIRRGMRRMEARGPEAGFVRAVILFAVAVPGICLFVGFVFGFVAGVRFHP